MPRVAVVVLNYNGLEDTVRCLISLRQVADAFDVVVLVDNASKVDPSDAARREYPGIEIIRNTENLGYAGGNNRGIARALEGGADYVLVLNNDTVVSPSIIRSLLRSFAADPSLGVVGPVINFLDEPDAVMTDGVAFNPGPGTEFFHRIVVPVVAADPKTVRVDIVNGCCMMVKADVFRAIGMFEERFFIVHEESDLCLRTLEAGFGCAVVGEVLVWHKGSSSFERSGRQLQRYFDARNLFYLLKRHTGRVSHSRRWTPSLWHYAKYTFYRYDVELEAGKPASASAVVEGVFDALRSRVGPYVIHSRFGIGMLRAILERTPRRAFEASTASPSLVNPMEPLAPPMLSFVIPVRDDAERLRRCLESVQSASVHVPFEIIVADNGSADHSIAVAREAGAQVLALPNRRVAEVRNSAAQSARGTFLAFVDADHELAPGWSQAAVDLLADVSVAAVGAQYHAPDDGSWVQETYDLLRRHQPGAHLVGWLPSGNLVIRREVFAKLGGFDTSLETCEDVDLCQRLTGSGGRLMASDRLYSVHRGDPATLRSLFYGELWRGRDNLRVSLRAPLTLRSLPSIAVPLVTLAALAAMVVGIASWPVWGLRVAAISAAVLAALVAAHAASIWAHAPAAKRKPVLVLQVLVVACVYDTARALALIARRGHSVRRGAD